jgi:cytoskeletal protein RodZ
MKQASFPGDELKTRREELGVTVYEAFRKTHVPANYIEALERADLRSLPAMCYAVGFLKSYCDFLGVDAERYVNRLRECARPAPARFLTREGDRSRTPAWAQDFVTWAAVMGILLLGWLTYTVVFQPQAQNSDKRVNAGPMEVKQSIEEKPESPF